MHATFINTKLREDAKKAEEKEPPKGDRREGGKREEQKERLAINAKPIFDSFGDVDLVSKIILFLFNLLF